MPSRYSRPVTVIFTIALVLVAGLMLVSRSQDQLAAMERPVATGVKLFERSLTIAAVSDGGWWARLRGWAVDLPRHPIQQASEGYQQLMMHPAARSSGDVIAALAARRAVALAALGRVAETRAAIARVASPEPGQPPGNMAARLSLRRVLGVALLGEERSGLSAGDLEAALAGLAIEGVGADGWTAARIRVAVLQRSGRPAEALAADQSFRTQAGQLRRRADAQGAVYCLVFAAGAIVFALGWATRRGRVFVPFGQAVIPPRWSLPDGIAVTVRVLVWGGLITAGLQSLASAGGLSLGPLPVLAAAAPLVFYLQRGLLPASALGLVPGPGGAGGRWAPVIRATLAFMAIEQAIAWATSTLGLQLGHDVQWTELVSEELLVGSALEVVGGFLGYVIVAPLVEEALFRGIVYRTLRTRLAPLVSAILSAGLFALAHFSTPVPTANIFLGAMVSALVYERTASLLPCLVAHAANNALAFASDVLLR